MLESLEPLRRRHESQSSAGGSPDTGPSFGSELNGQSDDETPAKPMVIDEEIRKHADLFKHKVNSEDLENLRNELAKYQDF